MNNAANIITATFPFDFEFPVDPDAVDRETSDFMMRAQKTIIEAGMSLIDENSFEGVNEIMRCFDLANAATDERGYVVSIRDRDCAQRLLDAGLLDNTADEIVERWGPVQPSIALDF